jgi:steroid 5-alpha reductase family enzyme
VSLMFLCHLWGLKLFWSFQWRSARRRDEQTAWSQLCSLHSHAVHLVLAGCADWLHWSAVWHDAEG